MTRDILISLYATPALRELLIVAFATLGVSAVILMIALVTWIVRAGPEFPPEPVQQDR